jgi:hypothetical protein
VRLPFLPLNISEEENGFIRSEKEELARKTIKRK